MVQKKPPLQTAPKPVTVVRAPKPAEIAVVAPSQTIQTAPNAITSFIPPRIPIPALAPREIPEAPSTTDTLIARAEDVIANGAENGEQQIALAVPIPVKPERPLEIRNSDTVLAQAEPLIAEPDTPENIQTAALSPTEIQDLRRQVDIAIKTPAAVPNNNVGAANNSIDDSAIRGSLEPQYQATLETRFAAPRPPQPRKTARALNRQGRHKV